MKSYQRRNKVWQSASPTPTEKLVLLAIESFADEESKCHPGKARLAHMTGYDIKTVQRAIASLEEKGLIEVHERYDEDGRQTSNGYRLIITQLSLNLSDAPAPEKRLVRQPTKSPTPGHSAPHPQGTAPPTPRAQRPPNRSNKEPIQKELTHSEAEVCFLEKGLEEQASQLGVDLTHPKLRDALRQHPERIAQAIDCLASSKNVAKPTQFLQAAIENDWRSRATGPRTKRAPVGFGAWFAEARSQGIAIASEMRGDLLMIFTKWGDWRPYDELKAMQWSEI